MAGTRREDWLQLSSYYSISVWASGDVILLAAPLQIQSTRGEKAIKSLCRVNEWEIWNRTSFRGENTLKFIISYFWERTPVKADIKLNIRKESSGLGGVLQNHLRFYDWKIIVGAQPQQILFYEIIL